jgi:hypothetical protein
LTNHPAEVAAVSKLSADLDHWLARWWQTRERITASEGYPQACPGLKDYRTSRQYDDVSGALDGSIDAMILSQIDHEIHELPGDHHAAIIFEARRLVVGATVFMSRRLPEDRFALAALVLLARDNLTVRLIDCGVLSR